MGNNLVFVDLFATGGDNKAWISIFVLRRDHS